ncbi:MAG: DUF349 domain-containing protein [Pseudomonadales bacterium]
MSEPKIQQATVKSKAPLASAKLPLAKTDDANANVTPLPLAPHRRVTPAGRKVRLQALSSIQELITSRKQLLIGLFAGRNYSDDLRVEIQTTLDDQQKFWALLKSKRTIYPQDASLFAELGEQIREHLDHTQRHGSFKQHLQTCAEAGAERQLFLIAELSKRLEAATLLNDDEVPTAVIAAYKALRMQIPGPVLADQLAAHSDVDKNAAGQLDPALVALSSAPTINARKEVLLDKMEELTRTKLDPRERAKRVRALRQQWMLMDRADSSYSKQLSQRFAQIGEQAYGPSKKYFTAVAKKLAENLSKRSDLATSLRDFYAETDWKDVDWKSVESTLRVVKKQWKTHAPTEREKTRPVKQLFETSYRNIDELLQREYDRNAQEGQKLVELMSSLGRQKASSASLEAMLGVQSRWKKIGLLRSAERRELKRQLADRASIVKLNRKKQLLQLQELRVVKREALSLVTQMDGLLALKGEELLGHRSNASVLAEKFKTMKASASVDALDKSQATYLHNIAEMFDEKYALFFAKAELMMQERRVQALDAYHEASRLIGNAEVSYVVGTTENELANSSELANDYLNGIRFLPRHGHGLLMNRLNYLQRAKE